MFSPMAVDIEAAAIFDADDVFMSADTLICEAAARPLFEGAALMPIVICRCRRGRYRQPEGY
jgi:hypothetical protein